MNFFKNIKHIIWDWNGTLVDDAQFCVSLINGILKSRSLPPIDLETYRDTFDFPVIEYYRRVGFDFETDTFETLSNEFISGYIASRQALTLHSGAMAALTYFHDSGIPQCILSASQLDALKSTLEEHGISHLFKTVLGLDDHYADGKLHLGKTWLKNNHIPTDQVLFIGDTLHDLEVARNMGIHCLLVATGHHSRERLTTHHPHVLESLGELPDLF